MPDDILVSMDHWKLSAVNSGKSHVHLNQPCKKENARKQARPWMTVVVQTLLMIK
jgi:hypothetical protein